MNFLNPGILSLLALAGLPVLIHLIHRRRAVERPFAAFEFLLRSHADTVRRFRWRQLLLLLLRTLFVLGVVLAAALPVLFGQSTAGGRAGGGVIVILDNSASMHYREGGRSLLEAARVFLTDYIARENSRRVKIYPLFGDSVETSASEGEERVRRKVEAIPATYLAGHYTGALLKAAAAFSHRDEGWEQLIILSDFLASDWRGVPDSILGPAGVPVALCDAGPDSARRNAALTGWTLASGPSPSDPHLRFAVDFLNGGSVPLSNVPLSLSMAGGLTLTGFAGADPGKAVSKEFLLDTREKILPGAVKIPGDALEFDDARFFAFSPPPPVEVLIVDGDQGMHYTQSEAFFLERALSDASAGRVPFKIVTPLGLDAKALEGRRVAFVCNAIPSAPQAALLRKFVEAGGGLFFALGNRVEAGEFNDRMSPFFLRNLRDLKSGFGRDSAATAFLTLAEPDHPAVRILNKISDPSLYQFRNLFLLEPSPGAASRTLLSLSSGEPLLLSVEIGAGKAFLFLSSLDMDWNDFPLHPFYLPFVREAVRYLGNARELMLKDTVRTGDTLNLPAKTPMTVETPDGHRHFLTPEAGSARFSATGEPGLYKMTGRGPAVEWVAVNADPAESEAQKANTQVLEKILAGAFLERISARKGGVVEGRKPFPLFRIILLLAAALALAEGVLAAGSGQKDGKMSPAKADKG